jgi:hypothetical protein
VDEEEVTERAVGLGLLRLPDVGRPAPLSAMNASRLLLSGYRLPALVEELHLEELLAHVAAGRHAFVLFGDAEEAFDWSCALQIYGSAPGDGPPRLWVSEPGAAEPVVEEVARAWLEEAWQGAGRLGLVAARQWTDLPTRGVSFFGGGRDRDGRLYWDAAACETDASGRVLRCS